MEPETESADEGLAGLLNRALNKGAILNADLLITVNDIPLVAVRLQAAIANIETMIEYGIMTEWEPAMTYIDDDYLADKLEPGDVSDENTDRVRRAAATDEDEMGDEAVSATSKSDQPSNRS